MIELLIGTLVTLAVGRYIFKGYSATGVLLSGGLLLLAITALMGKAVLPASVPSTGHMATDIFEYVRFLLVDRGGLGMLIMVLCGFAGYMSHIGANTILVKLASKPSVSSSPLHPAGGRLSGRLRHVAGGELRNRPRGSADGHPLPADGQHGDLPWRGGGGVRLAGRHHPLPTSGTW